MKNQLTSAIISLVLAATMTTPMYVFADEETVRTYEGEGYEVTYKVTGSWVGNQNVEVTLANTGSEPLLNRALKYDAHGEIGGLWNGTVYSNDSTKVIVKNAGYNYEVQPEQTVTFGYTLSGEYMEFPELVEMCTQRAEREPEKYSVKLDVVGDWQTGFIGNVTVENTGDTPLEAWRLSFDANFDIDTIWNAKMLSENEGAYVIANDVTTTPIGVGESKTFGFKASKENDVVPEIAVTALSEVVINDDYATIEVPENDLDICAYATYNQDNSAIELFWSTNHENGTFEVMQSVDGNDFVNAVTLENEYSYSYPIVAEFDKLYFKVKQTTADGLTAESPVIYVENTETGYDVSFIDSDDDILPDFLEEIIGTDINDSDTDKDGLTDYQEYYVLGTDPLVYDSVEPGVSDSDADNDGDGLSNKRELDNGTKPFNPDSDDDGLTDGEEENTYGTNPLKYDTDDDGISDGDEIAIGTDPLSPYTNGVADTERTFVQTINADDEILEEINTEYNPYELSLEITAAGNAHTSLTVQESSYSTAMSNDAILGACPELIYDNACKVDEVVVKFKVDIEFVSNEGSEYAEENDEYKGIKRYNIFRFFEEDNILLPVKTEVDAQNNTLSARTTDLGTYCLIDMEEFLHNIVDGTNEFNEENKTAGSNPTTTLAASTLGMYAVTTSSASRVKPKLDYDDEFNVVFMYDKGAEGYSEFYEGVVEATDFIFNYSEKANVYFIELEKPAKGSSYSVQCGYKDGKLNYAFHDSSMRDSHFKASSSESKDSVVISDALETVGTDATFIDTSLPTLCFSFFSDETAVYRSGNGYELLDELSDNVFVSLIGEFDFSTYAGGFALDMYHQTHGKYFYLSGLPLGDELIKYIYSVDEVPEVTKEYPMITSSGLVKVKLAKPITADYFEAAKHLKDGTAAREDFTDYADTDIDGLYDFEEIKMESDLVKLNGPEVVLPTFEECIAKYSDKYFYVESGLERYYTESTLPSFDVQKILRNTRVLPINGDPTREDSDGDGLYDGKAQYNDNNEIIAPKDDTPLDYSGPKGAWKQYIKDSKKDAPTELEGWYNFTPIDIPVEYLVPLGVLLSFAEVEGMKVFIQEVSYISVTESDIYNDSKFLSYITLCVIARCQDKMEDAHFYLQKAIEEMNPFLTTEEFNKYATMLGSSFLNFKEDKNLVLHSQTRTWQAIGGYNNAYDGIFSFFTKQNMDKEKFAFTVGDTEYIIWIWRGDYLNLGVGAEIGIYARPSSMSQDPDKLDHYFAFYNNAMPMSLSLYNSLGKGIYENIYSWNPTEDQWWCCGFNPEYIGNVDVHRQVMVGRLDMSEFSDEGGNNYMFDSLEFRISSNDELSKYMYFDDNSQTVWIIWGDDI